MIYKKTCGQFTVEVSDPSPAWVTISTEDGGEIRGMKVEDLRDLRHLIDRALVAAGTS